MAAPVKLRKWSSDMTDAEDTRQKEGTATGRDTGGREPVPANTSSAGPQGDATGLGPISASSIESAHRLARRLLREGQFEEAATHLRKIVFAEPANTRARASLGNCQLMTGDLVNAEASFRTVLETDPKDQNALYGLATLLLRRGAYDEAAIHAAKLVEVLPDSAAALSLLAETGSQDARPGAAIANYRHALRFDPDYQPALLGLANLLLKRHRFDEARELAERAAQGGAGPVEALVVLGDVMAAQGELVGARRAFEAALGRDAQHHAARVKLSSLARRAGDIKMALRQADDAWTEAPDFREAGNAVGAALAALGERQAAREVLTSVANGRQAPDWVRHVIETHRKVDMPSVDWVASEEALHAAKASKTAAMAALTAAADAGKAAAMARAAATKALAKGAIMAASTQPDEDPLPADENDEPANKTPAETALAGEAESASGAVHGEDRPEESPAEPMAASEAVSEAACETVAETGSGGPEGLDSGPAAEAEAKLPFPADNAGFEAEAELELLPAPPPEKEAGTDTTADDENQLETGADPSGGVVPVLSDDERQEADVARDETADGSTGAPEPDEPLVLSEEVLESELVYEPEPDESWTDEDDLNDLNRLDGSKT
ncbi:tetratricopeptide repeat protein [Pannonibacter indicus]|uniref:Tfp pilus assembly protein PilF n=1 Tax=Pannonibacter indicus TaxID=466044 RepID=A0A0K6I8K6_9HYPH|nr:tetratricopeptide repeat protein [Pannonibacter indicus]CUA99622.1 Tfp pilus assembly protein PilF [Pannonibacter indicus]